MRFRFVNKIRAYVGGYFWMPCDLCGKKFGGHEWNDIGNKSSSILGYTDEHNPSLGRGICPDCTLADKGDYGWLADLANEELTPFKRAKRLRLPFQSRDWLFGSPLPVNRDVALTVVNVTLGARPPFSTQNLIRDDI